MKRYQLLPVNNPIVEIECAGIIVQTLPMKNAKKNPNFQDPVVSMDVVCTQHKCISHVLNMCYVCTYTYFIPVFYYA